MKRNTSRRRRKVRQVSAKCVVCGDYLVGRRAGARFCSSACRQAAYRNRLDYATGTHIPNAAQWARAAAEAEQLLQRAAREMESGESRR